MSKNSKLFHCQDCDIDFEVTVEPDKPLTKDREEWLKWVDICPVCGETVERI